MAVEKKDKTVKARVKFLGINWLASEDNPFGPGKRTINKRAEHGELVELPEEEYNRLSNLPGYPAGTTVSAFYDDEEVAEKSATKGDKEGDVTPLSLMSQEDLIDWHKDTKPNVKAVVEASGGDPELAKRLLEAETVATGNDPRPTVVDGLAEVISRGGQ